MQQQVLLQLSPKDAAQSAAIISEIANQLGLSQEKITGFQFIKKSIDARKRNVLINLKVNAFIDEPFHPTLPNEFRFPDVHASTKKTVIILKLHFAPFIYDAFTVQLDTVDLSF